MKKFISMAMALVMTLSLCVFVNTTEAKAGFEDEADMSSQYAVQAADVIQTIEVMDGYDDGTFRPAAGLTRQAAAKIICNMILGPTTAKALPTSANPFPDVLAGNQFSGYISYCAQQGIISGYGDGTFRGSDPLSGYAYLKMLLGALGYNAQTEHFVGDNWRVNVAKIALGIGLHNGIEEELDGNTQVTREEAAIYAFNTLQADLVEYDAKNTIEVNGMVVSMGSGEATPQTWNTSSTSADNINAARSDGNNQRPIVQFAERYFDKLERKPNGYHPDAALASDRYQNGRDEYTTDDFGRPSIKWFWKGVEIGTYSRDPDAEFVGNVKVNAIYEALGMTSGNSTAHLYINSSIPNKTDLKVERGNDKDLDHSTNLNMDSNGNSTDRYDGDSVTHRVDRIGDGTLIQAFRNDSNNHVDVCVISVYGGKVNAVKGATAKKDAYVTIDYANDANKTHRPDTINKVNSGNNEYETEDFEEDDVVAYTYSDSAESIKSMYLMSSESGTLTSRINEKSLTLDNVRYSYGKEYTFDDMSESDLTNKSSYVVYLDENDYVLWIEEDEFAVDQYVLIERITIENANAKIVSSTLGATPYTDVAARVRYSSGSVRKISLDDSKNYRADGTAAELENENAIDPDFRAGRIVRLSSNSDGYRLHRVVDKYFFEATQFALDSKKVYGLAQGMSGRGELFIPRYPESDGTTSGGTKLLIDSETHFVVEDTLNDTYKPYVGSKNVPDVRYSSGNAPVAYIYHRGDVAKLIFITSASNVSSSSNDIVFLAANSTSNLVDSDDGYYYDVSAVDKNEIKTLRVKRGTTLTMGSTSFTPGGTNQDKEWNCVILNKVTYDSNDLITAGSFDNSKLSATRAHGIRRVNSGEVRLDTWGNSSYLRDIAENVRVYFVDGDDIDRIEYDEIVNDTMDYVYYVEDDGEITYLFIVDYDGDDSPSTTPSTPSEYRDGQLVAENSARTQFTFHYLASGSTADRSQVAIRNRLIAEFGYSTALTAQASTDTVYVYDEGGITVRVTLAADATEQATTQSAAQAETQSAEAPAAETPAVETSVVVVETPAAN